MPLAVETIQLRRLFKTKKKEREKNNNLDSLPGTGNSVEALAGVDIQIEQGKLFGLLGPNGAGKTTLIKILSTLLSPTSGKAFVGGLDVCKQPEAVRKKINMVSGGEHSGYGILNVRENLWMFSQFYGVPTRIAHERIDKMIDWLGLKEFARTKVAKLSTGMRQKMNVIRGFVSDPEILFLDEPTLGLDVQISREVRKFVREWVSKGKQKTVLLTTHYMAEADEMCDRVAIIDHGKVLACDTPANLKKSLQQDVVFKLEVTLLTDHLEKLGTLEPVKNYAFEHKPDQSKTILKLILRHDAGLPAVTNFVTDQGSKILSISKTEPTLEDVFVSMVGRGLE